MRRAALALAAVLLIAGCTAGAHAEPSGSLAAASIPATPRASQPAPTAAQMVVSGPELLVPREAAVRAPQPVLEPSFVSTLIADYCVDRDVPSPPSTAVHLRLLDRTYALPASYVPPDLVPASQAGFSGSSGARYVRAAMVADLAAMHAAMVAEGLNVIINSAYRSYATQIATFNSWVSRMGMATALLRSARPGHSEHQLGTTLDLTSPGWNGRFGNWATETPEGRWLVDNAWRYGFVMSYPLGSQPVTCFSYEPWHYRWIGRDAAAAHHASGLYLRPFLEQFVK